MDLKKTPIKKFEIIGLHGDRNVALYFESPIKILIDENGSGKTTVINALFNFLSEKWFKLSQLNFEAISITFSDNKEFFFDHSDFSSATPEIYGRPIVQDLLQFLSYEKLNRLLEASLNVPYSGFQRQIETFLDLATIPIPGRIIYDELRRASRSTLNKDVLSSLDKEVISKKLVKVSEVIKSKFPYQLLYFPTYRRVEEELHNLGYVEKEINRDEQLIQFGMRDVKNRFDYLTSNIKASSVEWYSIINGRMLTQLIDGIQKKSISYSNIENPETFRIVLDRVGENIKNNDKEHILELIGSGEIKDERYIPLAYFLSNLFQVYDQQRSNDNAIKNFARVVDGYLGDKEVRYNESKVDIQVISKRNGQEVLLERLSSGEKQVISIFSQLYLDNSTQCAIFFDEPELSLSMEWQKKLLQDIVETEQCEFLLAATHSPFIFENSLDQYASTLDVKFK